MGLRGFGAKAKGGAKAPPPPSPGPQPWAAEGLSRAERVILFVEELPCTSGPLAGTKFQLRPWQKKFIRAVYRTDKDGNRLVRTAVLSMGRGNGKTTLAAMLALAHLVGPEQESRGQVFSAANDRAQASLIFNEIAAISQQTPWLGDRLNIRRFTKEIEDIRGTGSVYQALSADAPTKHGLAPSFIVYDELGQAPGRDLLTALETSLGKREAPLLLIISTQAADDNAPLSELIDYGLRCQSGEVVDATFHLSLYSAPADADPWSRKSWRLANPALGDFRSLEDAARLAGQAQRMPAKEAAFRNLILNQRVAAETRFINVSEWKACGGQPKIPDGAEVFAGLDLGGTRDLSALVLAYKDVDGVYHIVPTFWLPGDVRERTETDRMPYDVWAKQGYVLPIGATTDPGIIAHAIAEAAGRYRIQKLAYDRWRVEDLKRELTAIGCSVELVPHGQGYRDMSPSIDVLERMVVERKLAHGNHPVLRMCADGAIVTHDPAGNRKLDKAKSFGRIDGLVALAMALGAAERHEPAPKFVPFVAVI